MLHRREQWFFCVVEVASARAATAAADGATNTVEAE